MNEISVIVTVYNSAKSIPELCDRLLSALNAITPNFEIVFIEDRSKDDSWPVLCEAAKKDKRIKAARMARNFGQHNAITAGIHLATGKYVVLMDGDLQDEPEVINGLYKAITASGKEIIYVRRKSKKDSAWKKFTGGIFYRVFSKISGIDSNPEIGTFRIMTRLVADSYIRFKEINKYVGGIFYWMDFDAGYVDAEHKERKYGKSNYNLIKLLRLAKSGLISFSNKPLDIAIYLGLICALASFAMGLFIIYQKLVSHIKVSGYSSIMVSVYFIGGIILMVLGIIGQYIGEIYDQVKARPEYILREKINFKEKEGANE